MKKREKKGIEIKQVRDGPFSSNCFGHFLQKVNFPQKGNIDQIKNSVQNCAKLQKSETPYVFVSFRELFLKTSFHCPQFFADPFVFRNTSSASQIALFWECFHQQSKKCHHLKRKPMKALTFFRQNVTKRQDQNLR